MVLDAARRRNKESKREINFEIGAFKCKKKIHGD
jgi:hypothetical protein